MLGHGLYGRWFIIYQSKVYQGLLAWLLSVSICITFIVGVSVLVISYSYRQKPDIYALKPKTRSKTLVFAILKHGYQFCGYGRYWGPMVSAQPTLSAMDDIGHQRLSTTDALRNLIWRILKNRCINSLKKLFWKLNVARSR